MIIEFSYHDHLSQVETAMDDFQKKNIFGRIKSKDFTVWSESPQEISNRMGWLDISQRLSSEYEQFSSRITAVKQKDFSHFVLLGMGGSSLAPDVFARIFDHPNFKVLDTTHPDQVKSLTESIDVGKTCFIVSTKSGGTVETLSLFKYCYNLAAQNNPEPGQQFIAITDPGSKLEKLAKEHSFLDTFLNDPDIGGRFSVLSYFGLVPAALMGMDLKHLLKETNAYIQQLNDPNTSEFNQLIKAGASVGALAAAGINKLTLVADDVLLPFNDWLEQLVAESTGKFGKGILPVIKEPGLDLARASDDRVITCISVGKMDLTTDSNSILQFQLEDTYQIGALMYAWEMITIMACYTMGINPFDQPDVELAKVSARKAIADYEEKGKLPDLDFKPLTIKTVKDFLKNAEEIDYVSLQTYAPYHSTIQEQLIKLQEWIIKRWGRPVTIGFGPRFLHSTGQLHKGDQGKGIFLQFFQDPEYDLPIPDQAGSLDSSISFGTLVRAQAIGDHLALQSKGRKVIAFESTDLAADLKSFWLE